MTTSCEIDYSRTCDLRSIDTINLTFKTQLTGTLEKFSCDKYSIIHWLVLFFIFQIKESKDLTCSDENLGLLAPEAEATFSQSILFRNREKSTRSLIQQHEPCSSLSSHKKMNQKRYVVRYF